MNGDDQAFAAPMYESGITATEVKLGLTKRELFALAIKCSKDGISSEHAVKAADGLIAELNKEKS